jgi:hypothetical protein
VRVRSSAVDDGEDVTERAQESVRRAYAEMVWRRVAEVAQRLFWPVTERRTFTNARLGEFLEFAWERSPSHGMPGGSGKPRHGCV